MYLYRNFSYDCIQDWIENKIKPDSLLSLKTIQLNIRGLNELEKFDSIRELLQRSRDRVDLIVLGETYLKSERTCLYNLQGYDAFFSCRNESKGGLALFIRNDLDYKVCANRRIDGFHHIHVQLQVRGKCVNCHAIYRPPVFEVSRFFNELDQILSSTTSSQECILLGDMNIPVNLPAVPSVRDYTHLLASYSLAVTNDRVTRPASNNVLDHVVCSGELAVNVTNETIYTDLSDHNLIVSSFKGSTPCLKQTLQKQIVDHNKLNEMFIQSMAGLPRSLPAEEKLIHIIDRYNSLRQQCTKTVTIKAKVKGHCPWMTFNIWKLIQIKESILKRRRRNPDDQHLADLLAHVSRKLQNEKSASKRNYYGNLLANGDQKTAWRVINDALGKQASRTHPNELCVNGRSTKDLNEICQLFNDFFCDVGPNLAATINSDRNINKFGTITPLRWNIYLRPTTAAETTILINELNSKKASGPDNIPVTFVKTHFNIFSLLLADVFNEMLETGNFPQCLKIAKVIPVYKSGDTKDPSNYRPISCLSVLDKIIEKLLVIRIMDYANHLKIIYEHQYGFQKAKSTLHATCDLVEDIYDSLDRREIDGAVFIDLKKAFDTIDHQLLLEKLSSYGFRGVARSLIQSYLSDRLQFVAIGESRSSPGLVTTGVPQGSNLGPILFLLFINDLAKLDLRGKVRLFADDTSLFYKGKDCTTIQQHIREDLEKLCSFFQTNLLSLNLAKTKYMLIHSPRRPLPARRPILINNHTIEEVSNYPFLGLTLDNTMSWDAHIDQLKRKLSSIGGVLRKVSSFLPPSALKALYFSLVHSRLIYLITIWGHANCHRLRELQVTQNRCLKTVLRKPHLFPTRQLYEDPDNSFLPVRALHELQMVTHIWKNPSLGQGRMHVNRASRQEGHFYLPRPRSEFGRKKIKFIGCKIFNALPRSCKNATSLPNFKRSLKSIIKARITNYLP